MNNPLCINFDNGEVTFRNETFSTGQPGLSLPAGFTRSEALNGDKSVFFATTEMPIHDVLYGVSLRFDLGKLSRIDFTITPSEHMNLSADAFYASANERYEYHNRWLSERVPTPSGVMGHMYEFDWGRTGAGRDKSDDVFVFVIYKRNRE
jgi:hypothetical protein